MDYVDIDDFKRQLNDMEDEDLESIRDECEIILEARSQDWMQKGRGCLT